MFTTKLTVYRLSHCPSEQLLKTGDQSNAGFDIKAAEDKIIYPSYLARQDKSLNLIEWKNLGKLEDFHPDVQAGIKHSLELELEEIKLDENGYVHQVFYKPQLIKTGIVISYDKISWSLLTTRSSVGGKQLLSMPHGVGIIDFTYKGPQDELLISFTSDDVRVIKKGDRIAQLIPMSQYQIEMIEGNLEDFEFVNNSRGGFGSTGIN